MITLREITAGDLEFARKLRNKFRRYFFNSKKISEKTHLDWFNKTQLISIQDFWFFIIWLDKERIGTISITEKPEGTEIGNVIIDKKYQDKGYLRQTMEEVFKLLDKWFINSKPFVKVLPTNTKAIAVYEALGFKEKERTLWK